MKNLIFVLFCLPILAFASDKKVNFYKGIFTEDLKAVKALAKKENKHILVMFSATWCMPCRWMEENTFTNPELADYMNKNFVTVKVDIDDIEGFALKERHKVELLPTMIVFDNNGKVLGRYAESMGAKKMNETMSKYKVSRPGLTPTTTVTKPAESPKPVTTPQGKKPVKITYAPGTGLYKIDVTREVLDGYSIQVAAASNYENVVKKVEEYKATYKKPILIDIDVKASKTTYKILVGEFKKREDAEKFMKEKKISGFIKALAPMGSMK